MSQVGQQVTGRERLTRGIAALSLALSLAYIVWRWGWTLDTNALWLSVPLALAESYGVLSAAFLTFIAWRLRVRVAEPATPGRTVDVFVTVYDEPISVVRKTALAARELRYPHASFLLDDGHRDEVRLLAVELGIGYIKRADRVDAKGGNLNHALGLTSGELILQLDADHLPLPHMIERLAGFFADEGLAFVQSPQDLYDPELFRQDEAEQRRRIWNDDELFFHVVQPGRDRVNAAAFVGSCGMIRRAALDEIGGFATQSVTEGVETSLLLHARGWRSAYYSESLAFALVPSTAHSFHLQHHHRGQGAMQTLRFHHPAATRGLTPAQRVGYLAWVAEPFGGFQALVLYVTPLVFLATGAFPIRTGATLFLAVFLPQYALRELSLSLLARGHGAPLLGQRRRMARFFTDIRAVTAYLTPKSRLPDAPQGKPLTDSLGLARPQMVLVGLTVVAVGWAMYERATGYRSQVPGWGEWALWGSVILAVWNALIAVQVIRLSAGAGERHRRAEHRFAESLAVTTRVFRSDGKLASSDIAVTENLNPSGLALRCMYPIPTGSRIEMVLPLNTRQVSVRGRVVQQSTSETQMGTVHLAGVEFDALSPDARDAIELHCAHHAMPLQRQRHQGAGRGGGGTARRALRRLKEVRGEERLSVGMPARVLVGTGAEERELGIGLLEDVSPRGGRVLLDQAVDEGSILSLLIPGSTLKASGRVVFVRPMETSLGTRYVAGFMADGAVAGLKAGRSWFDGISAVTSRYTGALMSRSRAVTMAAERLIGGVRGRASLTPGSAVGAQLAATMPEEHPGSEVASASFLADQPVDVPGLSIEQHGQEEAPPIADSDWIVDGELTFPGELSVGGTFVVTEEGRVAADIVASNAYIRGAFTGKLTASGTILVGPSARVTGTLDGAELVVLDGAEVNGEVARTPDRAEVLLATGESELEGSAEGALADRSEAVSPEVQVWSEAEATDEELDPDVEIFIPPRTGHRAPRG